MISGRGLSKDRRIYARRLGEIAAVFRNQSELPPNSGRSISTPSGLPYMPNCFLVLLIVLHQDTEAGLESNVKMSFSELGLLPVAKHDIYPFIDPAKNLKGAANGKTVLITGCGTGIGRGIAEAFAQAGAKCIIAAARRTEPLEETRAAIASLVGTSCEVIVKDGVDISKPECIKSLFEGLHEVPEVLVNNAGLSLQTKSILLADAEKWAMEIDTNVKGTFRMCQAYLKALERAGKTKVGACIINVSSNASWRCVFGRSSYAVSKVSMNCLSEYIDHECAEMGWDVRCFSTHPGGVMTDLTGDVPEAIRSRLIDQPALPGGVAVYLSTPRAGYLGGRFVNANWDMGTLEVHQRRIVEEDLLSTRVIGQEWRGY